MDLRELFPLSMIEIDVEGCNRCLLGTRCDSKDRSPGGGGYRPGHTPQLMIIGDTPGKSARLSQYLLRDELLQTLKLLLDDVFVTDLVKCPAVGDDGLGRLPLIDERAACEDYLLKQIDLVRPRLIMTLGSVAARALLRYSAEEMYMSSGDPVQFAAWQMPERRLAPLTATRGHLFYIPGFKIPVLPTQHPRNLHAALRIADPSAAADLRQSFTADFAVAKAVLAGTVRIYRNSAAGTNKAGKITAEKPPWRP